MSASPAEFRVDDAMGVEGPSARSSPGRAPGARRGTWLFVGLVVFSLACGVGIFGPFDRATIGVLCLGLMLGMIFLRLPVAIALALPGLLGTWSLRGFSAMRSGLSDLPYETTASWSLSVIPMFVFMGLLLWRSGATGNIYGAGRQWLAWLPGGLAVGTNFAGAGLAAVSGSSVGTTYALARIGVPEMLKSGYDRRLAVGAVVVAGIGGQLMPPSILLVVYAGIAQVPVGPQLLAGVGPGILVATAFGATLVAMCIARPSLTNGTGDVVHVETSWPERWHSLLAVWPVFGLVVIVIGGMFSGVLTATEAGAAAAFGAVIMTFVYKRGQQPFRLVGQVAASTVSTAGSIFFLLIGAELLSQMLTLSGVATMIAEQLQGLGLSGIQFMLLMIVVYLFMGMFMDPLAMMLLTVPILLPVLETLDISPLFFGTFVVFMGELAIVTPPVGILAYIIHGIVSDPEVNRGTEITLRDTFIAVAWFLPVCILVAIIMILFPDIATYLPGRMS